MSSKELIQLDAGKPLEDTSKITALSKTFDAISDAIDPTIQEQGSYSSFVTLDDETYTLDYSFERTRNKDSYAIAATELKTPDGKLVGRCVYKFGETNKDEVMVTNNIETTEGFRRKGYGTALFLLADEVILETIKILPDFKGKKIRGIIFAEEEEWSSENAHRLHYTKVGENIWVKTYQ